MTIGRSSPSGKALALSPALPGAGNPVEGSLAIAPPGLAAAASATLVSYTELDAKGGSYLVAAGLTLRSNNLVATGSVQIQFTPPGGPAQVLNARAYSIPTSDTQFRLLPQVVDLDGPGALAVVVVNSGANPLVIVESQGAIQPVQIETK
jgi:hypothetical protein